MIHIKEHLTTPVKGSFDLIIAGGGIAGISAAVAAKRCGVEKALIIEKGISLGGLATNGLIGWYEPLCDGMGHRLIHGISEELFRLAVAYGYDTLPAAWKGFPEFADTRKRCSSFFSPAIFSLALDELVASLDITVLFDTRYCHPLMNGNHCRGLIVEGTEGRFALTAPFIIDTTGDARIFKDAGVPCEEGENWLSFIGYYSDLAMAKKASETGSIFDSYRWLHAGADLWGNGYPEGKAPLVVSDSESLTDFVRTGRRLLFEKVRGQDRSSRDIISLPSLPQLRKTRRVIGNETLAEEDEGKGCSTSIGVCGDFTKAGKVYEIPFGTLWNNKVPNLLTAGRSISSAGWAWDVTRVIPVAAVTGQAAGAAAALCIKGDTDLPGLDINQLQQTLEGHQVRLHR